MIQTRHLNFRVDIQDFEAIKANAQAANVTISKFLRNLGVKCTPEVYKRFRKMYADMMGIDEGYVDDPSALTTLREENKKVIEKIDILLNTLDKERINMKKVL